MANKIDKSVDQPEVIEVINETDNKVLDTYTEENCVVAWVKDKSFAILYPYQSDNYGIEIQCSDTTNIKPNDIVTVKIEGTFMQPDFKVTYLS